eukprot:GHVN01045888.1.p1 GENE.GHVN01045888.1~~GHVN01045888.1.p1  ORF type:complete len:738 (-),score=194.88 GHVN01045888.1:92-2305(-)
MSSSSEPTPTASVSFKLQPSLFSLSSTTPPPRPLRTQSLSSTQSRDDDTPTSPPGTSPHTPGRRRDLPVHNSSGSSSISPPCLSHWAVCWNSVWMCMYVLIFFLGFHASVLGWRIYGRSSVTQKTAETCNHVDLSTHSHLSFRFGPTLPKQRHKKIYVTNPAKRPQTSLSRSPLPHQPLSNKVVDVGDVRLLMGDVIGGTMGNVRLLTDDQVVSPSFTTSSPSHSTPPTLSPHSFQLMLTNSFSSPPAAAARVAEVDMSADDVGEVGQTDVSQADRGGDKVSGTVENGEMSQVVAAGEVTGGPTHLTSPLPAWSLFSNPASATPIDSVFSNRFKHHVNQQASQVIKRASNLYRSNRPTSTPESSLTSSVSPSTNSLTSFSEGEATAKYGGDVVNEQGENMWGVWGGAAGSAKQSKLKRATKRTPINSVLSELAFAEVFFSLATSFLITRRSRDPMKMSSYCGWHVVRNFLMCRQPWISTVKGVFEGLIWVTCFVKLAACWILGSGTPMQLLLGSLLACLTAWIGVVITHVLEVDVAYPAAPPALEHNWLWSCFCLVVIWLCGFLFYVSVCGLTKLHYLMVHAVAWVSFLLIMGFRFNAIFIHPSTVQSNGPRPPYLPHSPHSDHSPHSPHSSHSLDFNASFASSPGSTHPTPPVSHIHPKPAHQANHAHSHNPNLTHHPHPILDQRVGRHTSHTRDASRHHYTSRRFDGPHPQVVGVGMSVVGEEEENKDDDLYEAS